MLRHRNNKPGMALGPGMIGRTGAVLILVIASFVVAPAANPTMTIEGRNAPDFVLKSLGGANLRLSEYRGEVVMITFWATWCGLCREEMPVLENMFQRYEKVGFKLLSVNIDDNRERAVELARTLNVSFPVLFDRRKEVSRKYEVSNMPATVLIGRSGVVRHSHDGYKRVSEDRYLDQIRALLRE